MLVRRGSRAAADADAIRWRLPVPGLPAEGGGGNLDAAEDVEIPLVLRRDCNRSAIPPAQFVTYWYVTDLPQSPVNVDMSAARSYFRYAPHV